MVFNMSSEYWYTRYVSMITDIEGEIPTIQSAVYRDMCDKHDRMGSMIVFG